jgi:RNase P protein component
MSIDVVVVPRREMLAAPFDRLEAEFQSLLARHPSTRLRPASPDSSSLRAGRE